MNLVIIAAVAVVVSSLAVYIDRRLQARKGDTPAIEETPKPKVSETEEAPPKKNRWEAVTNWRNRLTMTNGRKELGGQFQAWVTSHVGDEQLRDWIAGLSPEASKALMEELSDFCNNLGFELRWLFDDTLQQDPEIDREAQSVVIAYCTACWHAAKSHDDFELFKMVQQVTEQPFVRKHQALSRRLFAELVKRDVAPPIPAELFVADEKERQEHMARAITQAVKNDRKTFKLLLKEAMAADSHQGEPAGHTSTTSAVESEPAQSENILTRITRKKVKPEAPPASSSTSDILNGPSQPAPEASAS